MEPKPNDAEKPETALRPYTKPRMVYLGSVRDLTTKSGARNDAPPVHPRRP